MVASRSRVIQRCRLLSLVPGLAVATLLAATVPALAVNTLTQTVQAGSRSASVANVTLPALTYAHTAQTNSGTLTLTVDDSSATGLGWNVTVQSSDWVYSGLYSGDDIPAGNVALTAASAATATAGQAVDPTNGPKPPASGATGTLDVARTVLQANQGYGEGTYTQTLGVSLTLPARSRAGTYTGTLTISITAGP